MSIDISIRLLSVLADWAYPDDGTRQHLCKVAFRDHCLIATDASRAVIVEVNSMPKEWRFGVHPVLIRRASEAMKGAREVTFALRSSAPDMLTLTVGGHHLHGMKIGLPVTPLDDYPAVETVWRGDQKGSANGYILNPRYLAGIHDVLAALDVEGHGVRITRWSRPEDLGVICMESPVCGARFAVMPMRPPKSDN